MRNYLLALAFGAGALIASALFLVTDTDHPTVKDWTMPARFEGHGAFTLGCSLWDVADAGEETDFGQDWLLQAGPSIAREGGMLLLLTNSPKGDKLVSGDGCAITIDWSAIPAYTDRPQPTAE